MNTLKKYRFKLAWQNYKVNDVIEPTGMVRDWLLANGYVELVPEIPAKLAVSPEPSPAKPVFVRKHQRADT